MQDADVNGRIMSAIDLLKRGERDAAAAEIAEALRVGPATGEQWRSIGRLAGQIGEIDLSLEASRRFAATDPVKLSRVLHYWKELILLGRADVVAQEMERYRPSVGDHPSVLHVRGQLAAQAGKFDEARDLYQRVIASPGHAPQAWFSLSVITNFAEHPDWIDRMLDLERDGEAMDPASRARLENALGKAFHDSGDPARAIRHYRLSAEARGVEAQYRPEAVEGMALALVRGFTADSLISLRPSLEANPASVFVNGLPRSGTTLVEQILTAHSAVSDGAEVNLARSALIPTVDYRIAGARAYEGRSDSPDPWGHIARQYRRMLDMRFRTPSLVVDKSLTQSHLMGLIRHAMPACPVIWMRRDPADVAISCYRNFFTSPLPWCWSFEDMGHFFAVEDLLFEHWTRLFGEGILVVDYQELVREPAANIRRIAQHAGLGWEPAMEQFHSQERAVRTASLQQVRQPISAARVGQAEAYAPFMDGFRRTYDQTAERLKAAL